MRGGGEAPSPSRIEQRGGRGGGSLPAFRGWLEEARDVGWRNEKRWVHRRRLIVAAVRRGLSVRAAARRFQVSVGLVSKWVRRAGETRLDRVDWSSRPKGNPRPVRTDTAVERAVLVVRAELRERSALGEYGAAAIRSSLQVRGLQPLPCERTVHRILQRHGLVSPSRFRRPPPPPGWYLPAVASAEHELDAFDFVEGLALSRGRHFDAFTGISLWGSVAHCTIMPHGAHVAASLQALERHWLAVGRPTFAQFDNDSIFQGSHGHPGQLGRFVHACLCLGVTPIFTPPRETGFQGKMEAFNRRWQEAVWQRFHFPSFTALQRASDRFIAAHRQKHRASSERITRLRCQPLSEARLPIAQRVIFLRRADASGVVQLLLQRFQLPSPWQHRLVRCEIDLTAQTITCVGLRRRAPSDQPVLLHKPIVAKLTPWFSTPR